MTPEEISQHLDMDVELVEQALEKLEAQGLVERVEVDEEDEATNDDYYDPSVWEQK